MTSDLLLRLAEEYRRDLERRQHVTDWAPATSRNGRQARRLRRR